VEAVPELVAQKVRRSNWFQRAYLGEPMQGQKLKEKYGGAAEGGNGKETVIKGMILSSLRSLGGGNSDLNTRAQGKTLENDRFHKRWLYQLVKG